MEVARPRHVVLFPFPGQGHLAGFLALARLLRRELPDATAVTVVCTPRNVAALRSACSSADNIGFHALPFAPAEHGLPPDCESTSSLPLPEFITLFEAFEAIEPAFDAYVSGLRERCGNGVCIVADVFVAWTVDVARQRGCAHAFFVSCGAFGTAVFHALWKHMPALPFGPGGGALRLPELLEAGALHPTQLSPGFVRGDDRWTAYMHRHLPRGRRTDAVLVNTAEAFEPAGLAMLRRVLGGEVPVFPIGPLVRGAFDTPAETDGDGAVLRWLDTQPPSSVLYVSFGSQNTIRANQMMELAAALESTGRPFVWAVRPPVGFDMNGAFRDEWLPAGFEARARAGNRGLLVRGWVPQVRILAHASTGAFLSHCGWNSVLESLTHGVPLLGWPLAGEQFYNVKMLAEEWGVCVEVARGNMETSVVERSSVVRAVETVMGNTEESAAVRRRVAEVQELLRKAWADDGGSPRVALREFFQAMQL